MAINVPITNYSSEKISRHELLNWVNDTLSAKHNKIEELCTGVSYCQLMNKVFPGSVQMKRLKSNARMDHEYIWNLKLFQQAFTKVNCDKTVPMEQLMKGKFQDNFEFLLWFKKFYEVNGGPSGTTSNQNIKKIIKSNTATAETNNNIIKSSSTAVKKSSNTITTTTTTTTSVKSQNSSSKSSVKEASPSPSPRAQTPKRESSESPSPLKILTVQRDILKEHCETAEKEKFFYFERLRKVETLCDENEENPEFIEVIKKVRSLLYDTNGEETVKANELEDAAETIVQENLDIIEKLEGLNLNTEVEQESEQNLVTIENPIENLVTIENPVIENLVTLENPVIENLVTLENPVIENLVTIENPIIENLETIKNSNDILDPIRSSTDLLDQIETVVENLDSIEKPNDTSTEF